MNEAEELSKGAFILYLLNHMLLNQVCHLGLHTNLLLHFALNYNSKSLVISEPQHTIVAQVECVLSESTVNSLKKLSLALYSLMYWGNEVDLGISCGYIIQLQQVSMAFYFSWERMVFKYHSVLF